MSSFPLLSVQVTADICIVFSALLCAIEYYTPCPYCLPVSFFPIKLLLFTLLMQRGGTIVCGICVCDCL